jgi:hypothetical protein
MACYLGDRAGAQIALVATDGDGVSVSVVEKTRLKLRDGVYRNKVSLVWLS